MELRAALGQVSVSPEPDMAEDELDGAGATGLWGPLPSGQDLAGARWYGERSVREALAAALTGALTREQAAERLGITPQAVSERRKAGTLTALRRGRELRFPAWQFMEDGTLPEVQQLIAAWPSTSLALSVWAVEPSVDLNGQTPSQELRRRGGAPRVLELVEALRAAGW